MKTRVLIAPIFAAMFASLVLAQVEPFQAEALPDRLQARVEGRNRQLNNLPSPRSGFAPEFVIQNLKRWNPGSTIRVAFIGGSDTLRKGVSDAATQWLSHGNIKIDFGHNAASGSYLSWSPSDNTFAAEIRVSFDQAGYWSLVGRDSIDPGIVKPGEASMNFGGFMISLPSGWEAIVEHEFGHALGFEHEHQSPLGGCDSQFRWFDDPQYQLTPDQNNQFTVDSQGRRPGIYTVLGGPPNNWPAWKVDFNLKQLANSSAFMIGPFDPKSIMMYSFPVWMFVSPTSPCLAARNLTLSQEDIAGFGQAYPFEPGAITSMLNQRREFLRAITNAMELAPDARSRFKVQLDALQ